MAIGLTIHKAGAVLVSATEQIDDTPAGTLLHGIMAAIAEFYSKNLSHEAKKGLHEKAKRGGTPGYAPLGYLNSTERVDGHEVKNVVPDPERAPHIAWAFETYATGQWSITDVVDELARRGLKTRPTVTRVPLPLVRSQVHRILTNPYYMGRLPYGGMEYDGRHEALVNSQTWQRVQDVLSGRRLAGDRSWKHEQYLKGTLYCARCESRLGFGYSKGTGGVYAYFFCLGRNKKRTDCDLPYLPAERMEEHVIRHWQKQRLAPKLIDYVRTSITEERAEQKSKDEQLLVSQRRRLQKLDRQRQKLIDAYMAEAIPVADLKKRQGAIAVEERDAERLIQLASVNHELFEQRLEIALGLLEHCDRLYIGADEKTRQALNQAFFSELYIDKDGVKRAVLASPFAELTDRTIGLEDDPGDDDDPDLGDDPEGPTGDPEVKERRPGSPRATTRRRQAVQARAQERQNPAARRPQGSNVLLMAERAGFEPARHLSAPTRFPVALLRPLGHLSGRGQTSERSERGEAPDGRPAVSKRRGRDLNPRGA